MVEEKDVKATPSPPSALESAIASSPEVEEQQLVPSTEQATPKEAEAIEPVVEEERIPYSRFKDVVDEKNWYKQQMEGILQQRQSQQQLQQPQTDPYAGMTPEEERFWRAVDDRAKKIAQQELQQIGPVIDAGRMELAQLKVQQFRNQHPDIKENSPEEIQIAQKITMGYAPDDAYWSVLGPKGIRVAEEKGKQQVKQQIEAKKRANVESSASIPKQSQPVPKKSFRDTFWENWQKADKGEL